MCGYSSEMVRIFGISSLSLTGTGKGSFFWDADDPSALLLEHLHDDSVIRPSAVSRPTADAGDRVSWLIAFAEYCFQVPANRIGYGQFTGYQLKIIQEAITLMICAVFAYFYLREAPRWNYLLSFVCLMGAVMFAFWERV
jgi:Putative member of DMT superfamily (DUF486)